MILSEELATRKWCPFSRAQVLDPAQFGDNPAVNRDQWGNNCITTNCMAWRVASEKTVWDEKGNSKLIPQGYCGLAGKP